MLKHWMLQFGPAIQKLQQTMADLVDWLSNNFLSWGAYRAIMFSRLIGMDKSPGV
jgi:hypothetical protein